MFVKRGPMRHGSMPIGRRERARQDKRERIVAAARELFARHGVGAVTTQQIADRTDVAIGTLYLHELRFVPPSRSTSARSESPHRSRAFVNSALAARSLGVEESR